MSIVAEIQKQVGNFKLDVKLHSTGKSIGLLGASGCGKSLTLKCIAGIETPDHGRIVIDDKVLFDSELGINLPVQQRNVGMLFQNYALFPRMTVKKNIEIGLKGSQKKNYLLEELVSMFRLEGLLHKYPNQLSGGEQQRVALARSMSLEPEVLMLDEPFYALDAYLKEQLQMEVLRDLKEYRGRIIMVSHSRDELYRFCDEITVVMNGHIVESGNKTELFQHPTKLATARLTGCKNISRATRITEHTIRALDWNITLHTTRFVPDQISYVGIRAHDLTKYDNSCLNHMPVTLVEVAEGPYECQLFFRHQEAESNSGSIWWTISKKEWDHMKADGIPEDISFSGEDLLLLEDNFENDPIF